MARYLANENFPLASANVLREAGHDVLAVVREMPGESDVNILAAAAGEARVILTFDRDYGELIFRRGRPVPPGVIYFRYDPLTPEEPGLHLLRLARTEGLSFERNFTVVERGYVRQRPLP
jgi:predicted nuclease of predicted toxin-antitoxin system